MAGAIGGPVPGAPEPGDCKAFCYELDNLCNPAPAERCFDQCYAVLFDRSARCVQENVESMRCAVRAASSLPPDRCIDSRDLLLNYCSSQLIALQICQEGSSALCQESSGASPGRCALTRECGPSSQHLFECTGDSDFASCRCWTSGQLTFTVETRYPAEKACFDPMLTAACRPQNVF